MSDSCADLAPALALLEERAQLGMRFHHVPQALLRERHEGAAGLSDFAAGSRRLPARRPRQPRDTLIPALDDTPAIEWEREGLAAVAVAQI